MNAYDYENQKWVDGEEGRKLGLAQLEQQIALLSGPDGERYARFSGIVDREATLKALRDSLVNWQPKAGSER